MTHEHELSHSIPITINYIKFEPTLERYTRAGFSFILKYSSRL